MASVVAWLASFAVVVVAGYSIELNETYFGAGGQAPGATNDAVFTWLHQDIGLFLMPGLVLVAVAAYRLVSIAHQILVGWLILAGTAVTFLGAMFYVFVEPALHGIGYAISTIGLATTAAALLLAIYRIITDRSQPPAEPTVTPAPPTAALITH